jgi:hypothetical protein
MLENYSLIFQYSSCFYMTGLIWLIQLIHYPAYRYIESSKFISYQSFHTTHIGFIVIVPMILELFTGIHLWWLNKSDYFFILNLTIVIAIWLTTLLLSVPQHHLLAKGKDDKAIEKLIKGNWPRTVLWTLRSVMWIGFLLQGKIS